MVCPELATPGASLLNLRRSGLHVFLCWFLALPWESRGPAFALCFGCCAYISSHTAALLLPRASCPRSSGLSPSHPGPSSGELVASIWRTRALKPWDVLLGSLRTVTAWDPGPSLWAGRHGAFSALGSWTESHQSMWRAVQPPYQLWFPGQKTQILTFWGESIQVVLCKPPSVLRGAAADGTPLPLSPEDCHLQF